jgi:hypothetical protein
MSMYEDGGRLWKTYRVRGYCAARDKVKELWGDVLVSMDVGKREYIFMLGGKHLGKVVGRATHSKEQVDMLWVDIVQPMIVQPMQKQKVISLLVVRS